MVAYGCGDRRHSHLSVVSFGIETLVPQSIEFFVFSVT
jgi:hypothetical protein